MTEKKKLPVLGKSLMPEVLPDPMRAKDGAGSSARTRVRSRLEQIKTNAAAFAAASAIAACSDSGGKYGVVDPLPTPAGRGAGGNGPKWPTAGYGVVDPLPPPAGSGGYAGVSGPTAGVGGPPVTVVVQCSMEQALDAKSAKAIWLSKNRLLFMIAPAPGIPPTAVKLTQIISNAMSATDISGGQVPFSIQLESNTWPKDTYIKLTAMCGSLPVVNATLAFDVDTSAPKDSGDVPITLQISGEDAGVP